LGRYREIYADLIRQPENSVSSEKNIRYLSAWISALFYKEEARALISLADLAAIRSEIRQKNGNPESVFITYDGSSVGLDLCTPLKSHTTPDDPLSPYRQNIDLIAFTTACPPDAASAALSIFGIAIARRNPQSAGISRTQESSRPFARKRPH
jgi:hypothetical protein